MRVIVHYLAQLKQATGIASESVEVDGSCTVREFVEQLARRHRPLRNLLLTADDALQPTLLIFLGDEQVGPGGMAVVHDGAVITLLTPIAGG